MKEKDRELVIGRIKEDKEKIKLKEEKIERKEVLETTSVVQEYLKLKEEIETLNKEIKIFINEEDIIKLEFIWAYCSSEKKKDITQCNHDIWIYVGSYDLLEDEWCEHSHEYLVKNEKGKNFSYNSYVCLECDKRISVKEWEAFEEDNFVLKNYEDIDYKYYKELYYKLLYTNPVNEAKRIVIETFKDKLIKSIEKEYQLKKIKVLGK